MGEARWKAYGAAALVFGLDRATKRLVEGRVSFTDEFRVIPGLFSIIHSENRGVAFGILHDSGGEWRTALLVLASLAAVVVVSFILWRPERLDRASFWGLALVLGGAAGNLMDRAISGRVTDFLLFYLGSYQWPAFNVADSSIVAGSALLILDLLLTKRRTAHVS
jgi:signal peptidase II